jgi:putative chitinase
MADLTLAMLQKHWPCGDQRVPGLIEGIVNAAPTVFPKYGLTTPLTIAHAMAQFSHECGAGLEMVENLNYSAQGLMNTWPSRFDAARAAGYAHDPQRIANEVYGGRMGNAPAPADDGWNFRGRGLSQVTGREGYGKLADKTGLDLVNHPELLSDPDHALECGVADFVLCGCLPHAVADDVVAVTRALNGGEIGLAERRQWLAVWKAELLGGSSSDRVPPVAPVAAPVDASVVGSDAWIQASLNALSSDGGSLSVDGDCGEKTRRGIAAFQQWAGLEPTGDADSSTIAAIEAALAQASGASL